MRAVRPKLPATAELLVVEQSDHRSFNRGLLLNVGFNASKGTRVIMHDCDLLPDDEMLQSYLSPEWQVVTHFGCRFNRYNNSPSYFGGVVGFPRHLFPGFSNLYFGWGGEDDSLFQRCKHAPIYRPTRGNYMDLEDMPTPRDKLKTLRTQDKCMNKWELMHTDNPQTDNHTHSNCLCELTYDFGMDCKWLYCIVY